MQTWRFVIDCRHFCNAFYTSSIRTWSAASWCAQRTYMWWLKCVCECFVVCATHTNQILGYCLNLYEQCAHITNPSKSPISNAHKNPHSASILWIPKIFYSHWLKSNRKWLNCPHEWIALALCMDCIVIAGNFYIIFSSFCCSYVVCILIWFIVLMCLWQFYRFNMLHLICNWVHQHSAPD